MDCISIGFENSDVPEIKKDVKDEFVKHCTRSCILLPRVHGMLRFLFHWIGTDYLSAAFRLTRQRRDTKAIVHVYMPRHFMLSKQLFYLLTFNGSSIVV